MSTGKERLFEKEKEEEEKIRYIAAGFLMRSPKNAPTIAPVVVNKTRKVPTLKDSKITYIQDLNSIEISGPELVKNSKLNDCK